MSLNFIIHAIVVIISLLGLIIYFYAFYLGYKYHHLGKESNLPEKLYFTGGYPALIWYALPFFKQPRMQSIYDWFRGDFTAFNLVYVLVLLGIFIYFSFFWVKRSMSKNIEATKNSFYAPKKLLTQGIYGEVQHPMIIGDILCHLSLILLTGALYTLWLYPLYIIMDLMMIKIQVKYSLEPYFEEELKVYRKTTPTYFNGKLSVITWTMAIFMVVNVLLYMGIVD